MPKCTELHMHICRCTGDRVGRVAPWPIINSIKFRINPLNAKIVAANFLVARSLFSSKRSVGSVRAQKRLAML